ncbi:ParA family protein [Variovorax robiniae]|uniref:ParA family protein n=1 Tax=Variovorax robiniae TaxID=1836199 RepID=A0ABU8X7Q4_9BURK
MKTLAIYSRKGGSGKSTVSIHLAVVASAVQRVILVDADPQATTSAWGIERSNNQSLVTPLVARCDPGSIAEVLDSARAAGFELAVVDCPPHATAGTMELLKAADHIVIPVQASMPDLAASQRSVAMARAADKPFSFVVNRASPRAPEVEQALSTLATAGPVTPITLGDRRAFARALVDGHAVTEFAPRSSKAVIEVQAYWDWLKAHMKEQAAWPVV